MEHHKADVETILKEMDLLRKSMDKLTEALIDKVKEEQEIEKHKIETEKQKKEEEARHPKPEPLSPAKKEKIIFNIIKEHGIEMCPEKEITEKSLSQGLNHQDIQHHLTELKNKNEIYEPRHKHYMITEDL